MQFCCFSPIQDSMGLGGAEQKAYLPAFSFVTSTNLRISSQNLLNFTFNPFDTLT